MTVDDKILKKVEALLAKTDPKSGTSEAEAKTSAVLACKLIRENGLVVRTPGQETKRIEEESDDFWGDHGPVGRGIDDFFRDFMRNKSHVPSAKEDMHIFTAKYNGVCAGCQQAYRAGTKVVTFPRKMRGGTYHERCADKVKV